jgi:hypothetical protein
VVCLQRKTLLFFKDSEGRTNEGRRKDEERANAGRRRAENATVATEVTGRSWCENKCWQTDRKAKVNETSGKTKRRSERARNTKELPVRGVKRRADRKAIS